MVGSERKTGQRIALIVQYDGTGFEGFQIQNKGRTVQGEIENAVRVLTREDPRITVSGRTDSGVHALGQVVHFNTSSDISLQRFCIGLNGIMAKDVSVKNAFAVESDFHSRFSAREREYHYLIYNHPQRTPFMMNRAMWVHAGLDAEYLREVSRYLVGEMDFASFCKKKEAAAKNTVRRINDISIDRRENLIRIRVRGTAFLHNMVRIIVGTMVDMNMNGAEPSSIKIILDERDRDCSGVTAPPYGLYLYRVEYDPPLSSYESAW